MIETRMIRTIRPGKHIQVSTNLCAIRSNLPPRYPDTIPITAETVVARVEPIKPTVTEIRAPKIMRDSMSRPTLSVPIQNWADGGVKKPPAQHSFIP
ncbi:hypothetical protein ES708_33137 [subsurface metagenome]